MTEGVGVKLLMMPRVFVEDEQRLVRTFEGPFPEQQDVGVGGVKLLGGTFLEKNGMVFLDGIDLGHVRAEVDIGTFPISTGGIDDMQRFAKAVLEADGNHHSSREQRGEELSLFQGIKIAVAFCAKPDGVVALGETNRLCRFTQEVV